ncbi:MAG TPA: hypothetical protein VE338_05215 [Ktedonobacterales bacterium]|jgi:hypothetical protein|nr:hypothetical protein [Ktedonobacterales bacterium]
MEKKLYTILAGLAGIEIILGLSVAILFPTPAASYSFQATPSFGIQGFMSMFIRFLTSQWFVELMNLSTLGTNGVVVLGIVTAWLTRRRRWLIALLIVTALTWIWPQAITAWNQVTYVPMLPNGPSQQTVSITNYVLFSVPLIPVVMSLTFALTHRRLIPSSVTTSTDTELGIVRSSL